MAQDKTPQTEDYSLADIMREVKAWKFPEEPEASSPFIPLVDPTPKPLSQKQSKGQAEGHGNSQKKEQKPAKSKKKEEKEAKRGKKAEKISKSPGANKGPVLRQAVPAGDKGATPPKATPKQAPRKESSKGEEVAWLRELNSLAAEDLERELGPRSKGRENTPVEEDKPKEFGHLTLLPKAKGEKVEEKDATQDQVPAPEGLHVLEDPVSQGQEPETPVTTQKKEEGTEPPDQKPSGQRTGQPLETDEDEGEEAAQTQEEQDAVEEPVAQGQEPEAKPAAPQPTPEQEETGRDNLIPFVSTKEPETIREVVAQTSQKAKVWLRLRQDKVVSGPKVPLPHAPRLHLPDLPTPPDTDPRTLAREYAQGLSRQRLLAFGSLLATAVLLLLVLMERLTILTVFDPLREGMLLGQISLGVYVLVVLLCHRVFIDGIQRLLRLQPGMETLATFATLFLLIDGITTLFTGYRPYSLPLFAPGALVLSFQMLGIYWYKESQRLLCRTAARAAEPDLLTQEPKQYSGKAVFRRRSGEATGFGSQVQQEDGPRKVFRYATPLLLLLAIFLSVWASAGKGHKELVFWALSGSLIAASTLSGCLCYSLPAQGLTRRLSKLGTALAGWPGIRSIQRNTCILVDEADLFPPGFIEMSAYRAFNDFSQEQVISTTASLIRAAGSGLDSLFHNLIRMEEGAYVTVTELEVHNDGIAGKVMDQPVLVGNGNFLERMGIALPRGVRIKTGVLTAINYRFAGQFVLEYSMQKAAASSMEALLESGITPVLVALDFNMVPKLLRKQFRFPWDKMAFPDLASRGKLAAAPMPQDSVLMGLLSRDGLAPLSVAVAGAQRLRRAVGRCTGFACVSALIGILFVAYLTASVAVTALNPLSLSLFLIFWFVPVALTAGWVNQF